MRFLLLIAMSMTWVCSIAGLPVEDADSSVGQLQGRGNPYCVFPGRPTSSTSFTTSFSTEPLGYARMLHRDPPYERAGNSGLNHRIYERSRVGGLRTVIDVAPPDGHQAIANYEIEVRRIPVATPNAAGDCFHTARLSTGSRGPATISWDADASYTYYLTISED
uniref:Secreted in xylem 3 n=2 Tax=Fusarium oxysporum TaxID=5507 RepID=A0A222UAB4_FUSOC|nr:secreted in xylem 3 [Fusarium oxysporum f. sp. lycopersici]ASR12277.1 secreted in xylem 3 [Fusarium oxysporum f. sp. cubense]